MFVSPTVQAGGAGRRGAVCVVGAFPGLPKGKRRTGSSAFWALFGSGWLEVTTGLFCGDWDWEMLGRREPCSHGVASMKRGSH